MLTEKERKRLFVGNMLVTLMWLCAAAIAVAAAISR